MAPPKRKRPERGYSQDDGRPSPHRPDHLRMSHPQQPHQGSPRGGGAAGGAGRRQSRNNGRGGSSIPQSPSISHSSPMAMSPAANTTATQPNKAAPVVATMPTPAPAPSKPQLATPSTVPPTRKVPENNDYLTPTRVAGWTDEDSDAVVQTAIAAQQQGDALTLSAIFKEIISAALDNSMGAEELGPTVRSIVSSPSSEDLDPVSTFLSTLSSFNTDREKHAIVQNMLLATDIDVSRMRIELEGDLLSTLGLVRDTFGRVAVRKATHALYRQSNYNLLREETEGYSKLITEYFTTVNTEPPSQEVASETYLRVNALIGAFDLDIGRVLDVTLDVFANLLVKHGKFFVKFLRSSAWWPELRGFEGMEWEEPDVAALPPWASPSSSQWYSSDGEKEEQNQRRERRDQKFWRRVGELGERAGIQAYFELGARRILTNNRQPDYTLPADGVPLSKQQSARKWADAWIEQTGTLPPPGNDIAAQLLGFKLRFYASDTRDASDFLPDNLIYLAALLIKIGFISILDLYPHLYPLEEDMPAHKEKLYRAKKEKEQKERGVVVNALTMAGALPDEGPHGLPAVTRLREGASKSESERSTPAKSDEATDKKTSLPEPADQKYQLLKSLLCIGALPEALFILGRHSWLLEVYPELAEYILRLGHHSLSKLYEATRPVPPEEMPVTVKGSSVRGPTKPTDFVPRRILRWAKPDARDFGDGIDYKFYWEDWVDNVPVCQDVQDVIKLCTSLLGLLGPECGQDVTLLTKIVRIATKSLLDDSSLTNHKRWVDFSVAFIAPALSFTGKNPGIINEVWTLFSQFDTATRYTIYQQWFMSTKPVSIRTAFDKVRSDTNHVLSRVSTQNTKEYGRKLAKISYASPGIVFQLTLKRLINYPNMIDTLVECVRYLTLLGYDCLTWTLVNFLLRPEKGDTQNDGMLSAPWLKNIATFIGKACQRNALMDPTPLLQFTAHQLLQTEGELYMQDVLEQMCKQMGGISVLGQVSDTMVLSLCAGPVLRTFTLNHHFSDDRSKVGPSARRLVKHLRGTGLAAQVLIALAQHVAVYIYREDQQDAPDKVVLFNLDKMKSNLLQYLEMLRTWVPVEDFDTTFPGPIEMMADYHIEPDIALTIARASMAHKFDVARHNKQTGIPVTSAQSQHSLDIDMHPIQEEDHTRTDAILRPKSQSDAIPSSEQGFGLVSTQGSADIEMEELVQVDDGHTALRSSTTEFLSKAANPEVDGLVQGLKSALPDMFSKHPCMAFYVTFWSLSLPDIDETGIRRQYETNIAHFQHKMPPPAPERRGYPPKKESEETRRARVEYTKQIAKLEGEQKDVMEASTFLQSHLKREMWYWFQGIPMMDLQSDALHNTLLQDCFLPRSRLSLEDAQFASAMLKFMHDSGVPGFRTIKLLDLLFHASKLSGIISMYSETEAATFGRFLNGILRELSKWHENEDDAYIKFAHGSSKDLPGFGRRFDSNRNPIDHLQYDDFCKLLYKWHKALFTALKGCLESGDFQQIRNSLSILNALFGTFPKVTTMVMELETIVKHMSANDERGDIKITAASSLYLFSDNKITKLSEHKFRNLPEPPNPAPIDDASNRTVTNTAQSSESASAKPDAGASPTRSHDEINGNLQQSSATHVNTATLPTQKEPIKAGLTPHEARANTASPADNEPTRTLIYTSAARASTLPSRSEERNTPQPSNADRPAHALPSRPDSQMRSRPPERPGSDRHLDQGSHARYESRVSMGDYGRSDRSGDGGRLREASPGRRGRPLPDGRTPERIPLTSDHRDWNGRDMRDYDERAMRAPPRDMRAPSSRVPPSWDHPRDSRDLRELRERPDSRGQSGPASSMDMRRMHSSSSLTPDHIAHRREYVPNSYHNTERSEAGQPLPSPGPTSPATGGPVVNPARAALIIQPEHERSSTTPRIDREHRRERASRLHSPRRESERLGEERAVHPYHSRIEIPRDHRDERGLLQQQMGGRDRRDEATTGTPTGPRGGRNDLPSTGASWEMFQSSRTPRSSAYQVQDPNYGRLNQPSESTPPSGPRSERPIQQSQGLGSTPPSGPSASHAGGVHPSRMDNIQRVPPGPGSGPGSHGNVLAAPSGPRTSGRPPAAPATTSPASRVLPTGPAANDRGTRGTDRRTQLGTINNVLTQVSPTSERANDGSAVSPQNPPIRGRGSARANGHMSSQVVPHTPMPPPSHMSNPNSRSDGSTAKTSRSEYVSTRADSSLQDDGRLESRSHRDARRSERAGRDRSHSVDRSDRRLDERSGRNGPPERPPRMEGEERERSGRDKRTGDRDSTSRRDREGERSNREQRDSRRDRGTREDSRTSGHDRDRRSRGGGPGGDDGRKRGRDPQDQGQGHGDTKRRR